MNIVMDVILLTSLQLPNGQATRQHDIALTNIYISKNNDNKTMYFNYEILFISDF